MVVPIACGHASALGVEEDPIVVPPIRPSIAPAAPTALEQLAQDALWTFIVSQEGSTLSLDTQDSGNWTSGVCGLGELKGSKYGISAATFPNIDIAAMTPGAAKSICMAHYWSAAQGTILCTMGTPALAMVLTDAIWCSGPGGAVSALQTALGITADGNFGPQTKAAIGKELAAPPLWGLPSGEACLIADFLAERVVAESKLATWPRYRGGWVHRLTRIGALVGSFVAERVGAAAA